MLRSIGWGMDSQIEDNLSRDKDKYSEGLILEKCRLNLYRIRIITSILIAVNLGLLYVDIRKFSSLWYDIPSYKYLFYSHIVIIVFLLAYRYITHIISHIKSHKDSYNIKLAQILYLTFILVVALWCVFLAINAQGIHGQISAYIIGIFCLSSTLILDPTESISVYSLVLLAFILGLFSIDIDAREISGHIVNGSFLTFLSFGVSKINYDSFVNNFINKKIIVEQNAQLSTSHKRLEEAVKVRSEELMDASAKLVEEINLRHNAELEAMEGKLLCEEKTRLLNKAIEYENLRSTFFANISHELRTPLNVILSAQQMMSYIIKDKTNKELGEEKLLNYNNVIKQNCYRLIRLLSNLIDITKIDAGSFELSLQNKDIVSIVENITLSVVPFVESKGLHITFDTDIEEKIIACDPDKIERIMLNLISNAIEFTPKGGHIFVDICDNKDSVAISVKDTGIGIPPSMRERVFERFIQVEHSTRRNQEGSGIGLSLVKLIVEMHNGTIELDSDEGMGSKFMIQLPSITSNNCQEDKVDKGITSDSDLESTKVEKINIEFSDIYT